MPQSRLPEKWALLVSLPESTLKPVSRASGTSTVGTSRMNEECVVKFHAKHKLGVACSETDIMDLAIWRDKLRMKGLIGQNPAKYEGLGYGNLSQQMGDGTCLITGSQTGHLEKLTSREFARITGFDPGYNLVWSTGMSRPSSEAMTHLAVYQTNPAARYVFHVHCPEIWLAREALDIPTTDSSAECGTLEMFYIVRRLLEKQENYQKGILAMGGHIDGILAWGKTADETGFNLLALLARVASRLLG